MEVLLIIDMINDFLDPKGVLYCGERVRDIIPKVQSILKDFRQKKQPIIFLCDNHSPQDKEFEAFPPHALKGSWGAEIIPELNPLKGDHIIPKTRFNGFFNTDLESLLKDLKASELYFTGVCTSICVMDTVAGAFYRNFKIKVFKNAVGDFDLDMHHVALKRMAKIYQAIII